MLFPALPPSWCCSLQPLKKFFFSKSIDFKYFFQKKFLRFHQLFGIFAFLADPGGPRPKNQSSQSGFLKVESPAVGDVTPRFPQWVRRRRTLRCEKAAHAYHRTQEGAQAAKEKTGHAWAAARAQGSSVALLPQPVPNPTLSRSLATCSFFLDFAVLFLFFFNFNNAFCLKKRPTRFCTENFLNVILNHFRQLLADFFQKLSLKKMKKKS